jgi:LysR family transcriptional regulator, benzoate and cis,cis-muconate-responsive activator of ben and cat genes
MPFRRLKYFVAVAKHGSFSRAAEALNLAQSAVSRHVGELEQSLGSALFDRTARGIRLTPVGRVLFDDARQILAQLDLAFDHARLAAVGSIGQLTIGLNELAMRYPPVVEGIATFVRSHPGVDLQLRSVASIDQVAELRDRRIDAGFMIERSTAVLETDHIHIVQDRFVTAMARDHPLAPAPGVSLADLDGLPHVGISVDRHWLPQSRLLSECYAKGYRPNFVMRTDSERMQLALIAQGLGFGFVNESARYGLPPGVVLRPVRDFEAALDLELVWLRQNRDDLLGEFTAYVKRALLSMG